MALALLDGGAETRGFVRPQPVPHPEHPEPRFGAMIGRSPAMRAAFALLDRAARSTATVLLEGETGTGKGEAAAAIHRTSARRSGPFVTLDCGAVAATLMERELFGHERGAFTGAAFASPGVFEAAHRGTLFLDEIGEMPLELQPKLLRALESREVRRVGATATRPIDVRVVAATNRDLRAEVAAGRFRADLFFRLRVLRVVLPPLRERKGDIAPLVDVLLASFGASRDDAAAIRSPAFMRRLEAAAWPGNVRELRNCIERCLVFQEAGIDDEDDAASGASPPSLPPSSSPPSRPATDAAPEAYAAARDRAIERFERTFVESLLARHDRNVTAAASAAKISRVYLHKLMRRHGVHA